MFLLFVGWAVVVTWPLTSNIATYVAGDLGDPLEYAWMIGWGGHAITAQPLALFDSNMFFPLENTLVFSENLLGLAIPMAPLTRLTGNAILSTNVAILLSIAIGSFGVRRLAMALGAHGGVATLAGLAFAVAPYRVASIAHVHVLAIHFLPFALLAFLRLVRNPTFRGAGVLAAIVGAQWWTSMTGGAMTLLVVATAGVWWLVVRRDAAAIRVVAVAAGACVAGLLLAAPVVVAYRAAVEDHPNYSHPEIEVLDNSATPSAYLFPHRGGGLTRSAYAALAERFEPARSGHEKTLFPGAYLALATVAAVVVAAAGVASRRSHSAPLHNGASAMTAPLLLCGLIALLGFALSLGPKWGGADDGFPLPFALFDKVGVGLGRVPARFGVLVTFALALATALVLGRLRGRFLHAFVALSALLLIVEAWPNAVQPSRAPELTEAHRALRGTDRTVLVLPTTEWINGEIVEFPSVVREAQILWLSTANYRPMVNGYAAFLPQAYVDITKGLQIFPSESSMALLGRLRVDTVIVETSLLADTPWVDVSHHLAAWPGVRLLAEDGTTQVWDISQAADP
jgi:hypothetical protein